MKYTYDTMKEHYDSIDRRTKTTTNINELSLDDVTDMHYVMVTNNEINGVVAKLMNKEDLADFELSIQTAGERNFAWKPGKKEICAVAEEDKSNGLHDDNPSLTQVKKAVDPNHYQGFIDEFQWIEVMQKIYDGRGQSEHFNVALEVFGTRRYLDRLGKKDNDVQELKKADWYLRLRTAREIVGGYVAVKDVEFVLEHGHLPAYISQA